MSNVHDTFTMLKFSHNKTKGQFLTTYEKRPAPEQISLQIAMFLKRFWIYTILCFDPTTEPKVRFSKKSWKNQRTKGEISNKLSGNTFCSRMKMFTKKYFFKTTSASVFRWFWSKKEQKGNVRIQTKPHEEINTCTRAIFFMYCKVFMPGRQTLFSCFLPKKEQKVRFHRAFLVKNCRLGTGHFLRTLFEISPFSS